MDLLAGGDQAQGGRVRFRGHPKILMRVRGAESNARPVRRSASHPRSHPGTPPAGRTFEPNAVEGLLHTWSVTSATDPQLEDRLELSRSRERRWGTTAPAAVSAEERKKRNEEPVDGPHRPGWKIAMPLLLPDPRPRMGLEQTQRRRCVDACRLGGVELDPAEVLGTDEAVLVGADQSGRRAMVTVERTAIETLCDEHVLRQGVLDRHDRPVAVETAKDDMSDRRWLNPRLDGHAIEGLECDSLPVQVDGGPPSHAMKVGGELSARKRRGADSGRAKDFVKAPLISITGSMGTAGAGRARWVPKRGNRR